MLNSGMAENLLIDKAAGKKEKYTQLIPQIEALVAGESNQVANMANVAAALKEAFDWLWVGFYLVDSERPDELVLGPFQGPLACTRIRLDQGVWGASASKQETIIVQVLPHTGQMQPRFPKQNLETGSKCSCLKVMKRTTTP